MISPTGGMNITSGFGYREEPVPGVGNNHNGIDLAANLNDPVKSAMGGTVITSGWTDLNGNYIVVDHGDGLTSVYAHLNKREASVGDKVSKGQEIGKAGTTGASTGVHVHFGVKINGNPVNPMDYLS
jgi:murein DD-endopeptidase MepM/ murein hydrolase activator NlpD